MKVRYVHEIDLGKEKVMPNIMWDGKSWPMKAGAFPLDHPCTVHKAGVEAFTAKGYRVSPFPEGDGITMGWTGKPASDVIRDIEECLGWEVTNKGAK